MIRGANDEKRGEKKFVLEIHFCDFSRMKVRSIRMQKNREKKGIHSSREQQESANSEMNIYRAKITWR